MSGEHVPPKVAGLAAMVEDLMGVIPFEPPVPLPKSIIEANADDPLAQELPEMARTVADATWRNGFTEGIGWAAKLIMRDVDRTELLMLFLQARTLMQKQIDKAANTALGRPEEDPDEHR